MRWTRTTLLTRACACGRRSRVVLTPRRWCQVLEKQASQGRRWQQSPVAGESTKETVKTIARGMPDVSGVTVVTNACAFYHCTRGCGRAERPAFPAPSVVEGEWIEHNSGAPRCGKADLCSSVALHLQWSHLFLTPCKRVPRLSRGKTDSHFPLMRPGGSGSCSRCRQIVARDCYRGAK